ncbi:unnamed protein product [Arctogadus glacialis]
MADERYRKNIQGSPQTAPPPKQPPLPPRSSEPFSNGAGPAEASAMHRPMEPQGLTWVREAQIGGFHVPGGRRNVRVSCKGQKPARASGRGRQSSSESVQWWFGVRDTVLLVFGLPSPLISKRGGCEVLSPRPNRDPFNYALYAPANSCPSLLPGPSRDWWVQHNRVRESHEVPSGAYHASALPGVDGVLKTRSRGSPVRFPSTRRTWCPFPMVPVRTTSRSPVLSRRESPLPTQPSNQVAQRNVGSSAEPRPLWDRVEKLQPRPGSGGSSSGSSNSSSQAGSGDRFRPRSSSKSEGSPLQRPDNAAKKTEDKNLARPSRPADLTALAKELRAVDDVRPPHKVTDYSSSSDDSGTTDEEDDEEVDQEAGEESTSGAEDSRAGYSHGFYRRLSNGETESLKTMLADDSESDQATTPSKDGTLVIRQTQSASSTMTKHKSSSSFTPFIDPRLLQVSPSSGSSLNNMGELLASFGQDVRLPEALRADPSRKGSVVNVNPVNTRPQSDTPEIRKYKKRFNSEILCAALWGVNLLVGTESGLMLLDRSGQGKVYPLINRRRIQQMDVLEGLNVLVTISGKKNKLRVYYLSWLRNKILHNDPEVEKKQGWVTVGDLEGCVHYKVVKYERIKFLVLALKNAVEVYAWAPKPYHKFMAFKSFGDLVHKPLLVDLTVEEGQRLKVIYGSYSGFHAVDVDSGAVYDIYLPTHIQTSIQSHAIIILPNTDGIELLVCYEDEGVYVNTYGRITKDVVLQWGEMPTSVAYIRSNQIMGWGEKAIEIRSVETGHLDGVFMHKRAQRLKFLCERNDKVFFASVRSGGASQVYFMTLGRTSLMSW